MGALWRFCRNNILVFNLSFAFNLLMRKNTIQRGGRGKSGKAPKGGNKQERQQENNWLPKVTVPG